MDRHSQLRSTTSRGLEAGLGYGHEVLKRPKLCVVPSPMLLIDAKVGLSGRIECNSYGQGSLTAIAPKPHRSPKGQTEGIGSNRRDAEAPQIRLPQDSQTPPNATTNPMGGDQMSSGVEPIGGCVSQLWGDVGQIDAAAGKAGQIRSPAAPWNGAIEASRGV